MLNPNKMKIPTTGKECPYFYGDYYRGRHFEECRLISKSKYPWEIKLCKTCLIPDIVIANACPHMILSADISSVLFGLKKRVKANAYCLKTHHDVEDPFKGCGQCHPAIDFFNEI